MGLYTKDMAAYRSLLSKQMFGAHWHGESIFAKMYGHIGGADGKDGEYPRSVAFGSASKKLLTPTFKPIEVLTDFEHLGGIDMDIPIHYPLVEEAIYGDIQAKGTGEQKKFAYVKAYINQVTKVFLTSTGLMGDQTLQNPSMIMKLMKNAQQDIITYHKAWQGYAPYDGFTRGYSRNVLAPVAKGGLGLTQVSHPNFFVAGSGKATWSDTPATYETNVATILGQLTDTSSDHFSTTIIENMVAQASSLKIRPAELGGITAYVIVINPAQALQLKRDTKWVDAVKSLAVQKEELSRLFTGHIEGFYAGALILTDLNAPGCRISGDDDYVTANGTVNYGNLNPIANPIDTANKKLAILFGASAIVCGHAKKLQFENELDDFGRKKEEAGFTILGYRRSDIYDMDGFYGTAGLFKENSSSLVCATYSPNSLSW